MSEASSGGPPIDQQIAARYVRRVLANAAHETVKPLPSRLTLVGSYAIVLIAVAIVRFVSSSGTEKAVDALVSVLATIGATILVGAAFVVINVFRAPSRLDRLASQAIAEANNARIAAEKKLEDHLAATRVTVVVEVVPDGQLRTVDVSEATTTHWVAGQRAALGNPTPIAEHVSVRELFAAAATSPLIGAGWSEDRTPDKFRGDVDAWLPRARAAARDELLRLGLEAHLAEIHVFASNTGHRHLSEVRVRLRFGVAARAAGAYELASMSSFPTPPRRWGTGRYSNAVLNVGELGARMASARIDVRREIYERDGHLVIELGPYVLPPGDRRYLDSIVLGIPASTTSAIVGTWRATAKEAEDDATGALELAVALDAIDPDALEKLIVTRRRDS